MTQRWMWETTGPGVSGSSGDLGKMFKNESVKQQGAFSVGAPPAAATLLAREVIQNSWDAARELQRELDQEGQANPDFEITFKFRSSSGAAKQTITDRLGLGELANRADQLNRSALGLRAKDCLSDLSSSGQHPAARDQRERNHRHVRAIHRAGVEDVPRPREPWDSRTRTMVLVARTATGRLG